ncbi:glycerophosphodiester phosphodiesterase family protein [Halobacteriovorax sp.]|uniref:glycerophosphodiester phosphodiesterase family protein n=1 Tax=Halobacteriovorax sp. TaxID=2020862 RepID=UPI003561BB13
MNWLSKTPIAHRGLHDIEIPENSLGAFKSAIDSSYVIELDVRLTKDGKVVVFHDLETSRLMDQNYKISDTDLSELEELALKGSNFKIPSLKTVLDFVAGRVPLLIEIKNESKVGLLENELVRILDDYKGEFALQSFNPLSLKYISKVRPDFKIGLLVGSFSKSKLPFVKKIFLKYMLLTPYLRPDFFSIEYGVNIWMQKSMLKIYNDRPILYWTIKNKETASELIKSGHGVIFEGFKI